MTEHEALRDVPGILHPSREYFQGLGFKEGDQIVYYRCVGICMLFVELLAVAVRGLRFEQDFVPLLDESKAKVIHNVGHASMWVDTIALHPATDI